MTSDFGRFRDEQIRALEQDPGVFEFRANPGSEGIYKVMASRTGHGALVLGFETALNLANRIRAKHPDIAKQIDKCVDDGRRYDRDANSASA